jgi:hypothetical protein
MFYMRIGTMIFFLLITFPLFAQQAAEGRWDLTVTTNKNEIKPAWLEVKHSGIKMLVGYFVAPDGGSARPVARVNVNGQKISFAIPPQWEAGENDLVVEGEISGSSITGTMTMPNGSKYSFTGLKAPSLERSSAPVWGDPITLFNGKNTEGWHASGAKNQWVGENGVLRNPSSGSNLITDRTFSDFKLHIEFRYPPKSNSGIYLRGRYEVQVEDSPIAEPTNVSIGGIYGFVTPNQKFTKGPNEWQVYDITIVGRRVTVVANGKTIICDQVIPGITGGALDSKEGEPGPIMLQGDHGPVEFRNIVITPSR